MGREISKPIYFFWALCLLLLLSTHEVFSQRVPNESENIDYLVTYGKDAPSSLGDDDHVQILFFSIPLGHNNPVYVRLYDPETGGRHDEINGSADTHVRYSIYGGKGAFTNPDAQKVDPVGEFKSGSLLASKIFGGEPQYDDTWVVLSSLNPMQGEQVDALKGYIFKLIVEGVKGNDANRYRLFISDKPDANRAVQGANAFAYEYTFDLPRAAGVSHIYPFVDPMVTAVNQSNFDLDQKGEVLMYSVTKNRRICAVSRDAQWAKSSHAVDKEEKNTTIDIQIQKGQDGGNTLSFYVTNQYDQAIPFFAIPIGGPPKYKYDPSVLLKAAGSK